MTQSWDNKNIFVTGIKKKIPFKALKGVSVNIENGMFGLLGPNGAGKSTLMKIICGILEQSYGQITINGIDVREKREELQGLIDNNDLTTTLLVVAIVFVLGFLISFISTWFAINKFLRLKFDELFY